ncbi:hypothetical protein ACFFMR_15040 [Micromonospora andamanensis]|uniref:Uncharacterized protein n=1 Tax=Micromonospora andamanensis TaxID=1287068 RepID=A0ABQ4I662_9ACTN|nr:hypothetical protein [Micromonospora andamanensis]GIJ13281.1 hypothetical protein Van01_64950 [Micromonospora andamanensis]
MIEDGGGPSRQPGSADDDEVLSIEIDLTANWNGFESRVEREPLGEIAETLCADHIFKRYDWPGTDGLLLQGSDYGYRTVAEEGRSFGVVDPLTGQRRPRFMAACGPGRASWDVQIEVGVVGCTEDMPQGCATLGAGPAMFPAFQFAHPAMVDVVGGETLPGEKPVEGGVDGIG